MKCSYLKYVCLCIFLLASSLSADWSDPITIPDSSSYSGVKVVVDPAGNATAVWFTASLTVETASKPVGGVWSTSQIISNIGQDSANPSLVVDPYGNVTVVWSTFESNAIIQSVNKPFGGGWSSVDSLTSLAANSTAPRLAVDADGNVTVVFEEKITGRVQSVNKPFGGNWSNVENVSDNGVVALTPNIATTAAGVLTAIWQGLRLGDDILQSKTKNFDGSWGTVEEIPSSEPSPSSPKLVVDQSGNVSAIWSQGNFGNNFLQASTKPSGGSWEPATNLSEVGELSSRNLTVDQNGTVTTIWGLSGVTQSAEKTLNGSWSTASDISTLGQPSTAPEITVDQYGNVTAVWVAATAGIGTFQSAAKPIGGNWSSVIDLSPIASNLSEPSLGIDSSGRITALWGQAGSLQSRTYQPPVVTSLSPNFGPPTGGNTVEITGNGFGSATAVLFGAFPATFIVNSPTSITVIAPQVDLSSVDVKIVTSNGIVSPESADSLYTYNPSTEIPPPSNFVGKIRKNIFLNKTDHILKATWTPSSSPDVAYYVIYKGNQAVNIVKANGPFIFQDAIKNKSTNYLIKAVGTNGLESVFVPLVLQK